MVLPRRLEINIPPAVTTVAEAAVGHDVVMRAVASAVLQVSCKHEFQYLLLHHCLAMQHCLIYLKLQMFYTSCQRL